MKTPVRFCGVACASVMLMTACGGSPGGVSGRYEGNLPGGMGHVAFDFQGEGKATMSVGEGGNGVSLDCTWQKGEKTIAVGCPGSSGITMTPLDGGDLEANMGGTIVRFEKD